MDRDSLRAVQQELKDAYRAEPGLARVTLEAEAALDAGGISCSVRTGQALAVAGLHPASGGDGSLACSGDMLLQALAACAGVTMRAVATSAQIPVTGGTIRAEGDLDFRGTLAVDKAAPVGFTSIRLCFELAGQATDAQIQTLLRLTECYCVVYQTLAKAVPVAATAARIGSTEDSPQDGQEFGAGIGAGRLGAPRPRRSSRWHGPLSLRRPRDRRR